MLGLADNKPEPRNAIRRAPFDQERDRRSENDLLIPRPGERWGPRRRRMMAMIV